MSHPQTAVLPAEAVDEWRPHAPVDFQEVGKVGRVAIGLLGASTVTHLLSTWSDWNTYGVVHRYLGGMPNVDDADLNRADTISRLTSIPNVVISVAAAVVFVIWLWRSRVNSEVLCQADHRHSHGWVLASWFCPGPNLWYPKQIVDDVWLASDPRTPAWSDDLGRLRKPLLTSVWWCSWVGALAFDVVIRRFLMWMDPTVGSLRSIALAGTASLLLTAVSALGATLVIRKITGMQQDREWIAWWDQREPAFSSVPEPALTTAAAVAGTVGRPPVDADSTMIAPATRLERQRELQFAGPVGTSDSPSGGEADGLYSWLGPSEPKDETPAWSPFNSAPLDSWDQPADATQQFSPYDAWRDEPGPVEEAPAVLQPSDGLEPPAPTWSTQENPYRPADDVLSAPLPGWQTESVTPLPMPSTENRWTGSYAESPGAGQSSPDYLSPSAPIDPPEPAPAARPGRRAAKVAVDSPSAIQAAVNESVVDSDYSYRGNTEQEPAAPGSLTTPLPDDFLTPSKPLPPVPSFGPEPSYQAEPSSTPEFYSPEPDNPGSYSPEPYNPGSYNSGSYNPEPYSPESSYPESSYPAEPNDGSGDSPSSWSQPSYESYPSSDADYGYSSATEWDPAPDRGHSASAQESPAEEKDDSEITASRAHPRRRWV